MVDGVEHLLICLLAICISSLEKCLFIFFAHLLIWLFVCVCVYVRETDRQTDRRVYFLSHSDKRTVIWVGVQGMGKLLNVVKKLHRPEETIQRKNEIELYHEIESCF